MSGHDTAMHVGIVADAETVVDVTCSIQSARGAEGKTCRQGL